jgi:hypothetical protein
MAQATRTVTSLTYMRTADAKEEAHMGGGGGQDKTRPARDAPIPKWQSVKADPSN